jgi:hypothetical protein
MDGPSAMIGAGIRDFFGMVRESIGNWVSVRSEKLPHEIRSRESWSTDLNALPPAAQAISVVRSAWITVDQ